MSFGAEEDRGAEYALERRSQTSVLRPALLHAEDVQYLGCAGEGNHLALLRNGERRQKDGNQSILAPRKTVIWMSGHLQNEIPFPPLMEQPTRDRPFDGKTVEDEWTGGETDILTGFLPLLPDHLNDFGLPNFLF